MSRATVNTAEFDRALKDYVLKTKKSIPEVLNTKAYWVARNAIQLTRISDKAKINAFAKDWAKSGPTIIKAFGLKTDRSGGWTRKEVQKKFAALRRRSIGYLRSGWIPTLRATGGWAKQPKNFKGVAIRGKLQGWVKLATKAWDTKTIICNAVGYNSDQADAARKYVRPALSKSIAQETASMRQYLEKKQKEILRKARIKHR